MVNNISLAILIAAWLFSSATYAAESATPVADKENATQCCAPTTEEKAGIIKAITAYIDAGRAGNSAIAKKAFTPEATMSWAENGKLKVVPIQELYNFFDKGPTKASCELVACCVANDVAMAAIESQFDDARFTDMFTLVKDGLEWKIVSKVYNLKNSKPGLQPGRCRELSAHHHLYKGFSTCLRKIP